MRRRNTLRVGGDLAVALALTGTCSRRRRPRRKRGLTARADLISRGHEPAAGKSTLTRPAAAVAASEPRAAARARRCTPRWRGGSGFGKPVLETPTARQPLVVAGVIPAPRTTADRSAGAGDCPRPPQRGRPNPNKSACPQQRGHVPKAARSLTRRWPSGRAASDAAGRRCWERRRHASHVLGTPQRLKTLAVRGRSGGLQKLQGATAGQAADSSGLAPTLPG